MDKIDRRIDWSLIDEELEDEIDFQNYMDEMDKEEIAKEIEHIEREWTKWT